MMVGKASGVPVRQLVSEGYSILDLKEAGFKPDVIRREANCSLADLKKAGFTTAQFKADGFGPGELQQAGFDLKAIKAAGFQAKQLGLKAGFTIKQLHEAGYQAVEVKSIGGITPEQMLEAGFTKKQVAGAFTKAELSGEKPIAPASPDMLDVMRGAKDAKPETQFSLPEKKRIGLEGMDMEPPAPIITGPSGRIYHSRSFLCMRPHHEPRRTAICVLESWPFEPIILITIICNCLTMAWESNLDPPGTPKAAFISQCESAYLTVYTIEMCVKMLGYGIIFHRRAYLRDFWGVLDFTVVTIAWIPILTPMSLGDLSVFRSIRVLRFLRALKMVPGMPMLVNSILDVLPKMGSVSALCTFVFAVFGIVGMNLFKGQLHYRCAEPGFVEIAGHPVSRRRVAEVDQAAWDTEIYCNPARSDQCSAGQTCAYFQSNPGADLTSFDNIGVTMVILLQAITFDDWANPMFALMESGSPWTWVYFVLIVVFGGFFVINLFLAVIFDEFLAQKRYTGAVKAMDQRAADAQANADESTLKPLPPPSVMEAEAVALLAEHSPEIGVPSTPHEGPLSMRGRTQMLMAAAHSPNVANYLMEKRHGLHGRASMLTEMATSSWLSNGSTALVVINMLLMCMPYEGMSVLYAASLETSGTVITSLFVIEMGIKLGGLGCAGYWGDGWNVLDGCIVIESLAEVVIVDVLSSTMAVPKLSFLRILRMFRILRVLRLMKKWKGLYKIIMSFGNAIPQMGNLFVLMMLCQIIFALLGMQIFGGLYNPESGFSSAPCPGGVCPNEDLEELPYYHFDYFGPAMQTVFILMSGEWMDAMSPATEVMGWTAMIYFISAVLIGRYFVMNLFVGVLLNAFAEEEEEEADNATAQVAANTSSSEVGSDRAASTQRSELHELGGDQAQWPDQYSLFIFGPQNLLRQMCNTIVQNQMFDQFILLVILASTICLGLDSPRNDPTSDLAVAIRQLDFVWTIVFVTEMVLKVIANGFAFSKGAYIRQPWNQLDFTIVCITLVTLLAEQFPQLRPFKALRVLRALRPLRLISRIPQFKIIVTSLARAMPEVANALMVVLAIQSVFAILGMQIFSGTMASCTDPSIQTREECVPSLPFTTSPAGDDVGRQLKGGSEVKWEGHHAVRWQNPAFGSFDNFGDAMLLLYIMASGDYWEAPMQVMMAATEPGKAPLRNDYSPSAFYSIAWMFIGSYIALNLFVGVIVESFDKIRKETDQSATMTVEQQQWVNAMKAMTKQEPTRGVKQWQEGYGPCRLVFNVVNSALFDGFITAVIIGNIGLMACEYWGIEQDDGAAHAYDRAMQTFISIYYIECILKIIGLGPRGYFGDSWCRFDFFLVCTALADQLGSELMSLIPMPPYLLRVLRVFRILRILRLLKGAKELRNLLVTMILSFPSLINVSSLLAVVMFIYSVLGLHLFTFLVPQENINEVRNFGSLSSGFLVLFQCLTGDAWSALMGDAMVDEGSGRCSSAEGNCGSVAAIPYFVSFQVVGVFVFLNLIVAVILENFSSLGSQNPDVVSAADIETFKDTWAEFDPDADNYIPSKDLPRLVLSLPPPMGLRGVGDAQDARKLCTQLENLNQKDGQVSFQDTLSALTRHSYFNKKSTLNRDELEALEAVPVLSPTKEPVPKLSMSPEISRAETFHADRFADDLPSVRRVFALHVIEQYSAAWKANREGKPPKPPIRRSATSRGMAVPSSYPGSARTLLGKPVAVPPPPKKSSPPKGQMHVRSLAKCSPTNSGTGMSDPHRGAPDSLAGWSNGVTPSDQLSSGGKVTSKVPSPQRQPSASDLDQISAQIAACRSSTAASLRISKPSPPKARTLAVQSTSAMGVSPTQDHTCCGR